MVRHQFLTSAAFAKNEDPAAGARHQGELLPQRFNGHALADNSVSGIAVAPKAVIFEQ
jgi:hypothetical protein